MKTKSILGAISVAFLAAGSASASTITWNNTYPNSEGVAIQDGPTSLFTYDEVLDLALAGGGTEEYGIAFGSGPGTQTVVTPDGNTLTFNDDTGATQYYVFTNGIGGTPVSPGTNGLSGGSAGPGPYPTGSVSTNGVALGSGGYLPYGEANFNSGSPPVYYPNQGTFDFIMNNGVSNTANTSGPLGNTVGSTGTGYLTDLIMGNNYTLLILNADEIQQASSAVSLADDGTGSGIFGTTGQFANNHDNEDGDTMGGYILGTFTADCSGYQIVDTEIGGGVDDSQSGFLDQVWLLVDDGPSGNGLCATPEPAADSMILLGLASLLGLRQLRRKSAGFITSQQI